jgi:transglutaminase-like putative cysteine protease
MQIAAGAGQRIQYQSSGVMRSVDGLGGMRRYTVWSYAPRPTPTELARSPASYPRELARDLDVGRATVPTFGTSGRSATVSAIFRDTRYQAQWPYAAVWSRARQLTNGARSPYEATLRIERWLRRDGGFVYDERPPAPAAGVPPLVDFVQRSKLGYCQQFAGTMALMLRYLGIPARVAVGFTSGKWENNAWTVTDHDAHAWVEAWFAGHGWLTFDPTPGRATLSAEYTNASDSADALRALGTRRFLGIGPNTTGGPSTKPVAPARNQPRAGRPTWPFTAPAALLAVALLGLAAVKRRRRVKRATTGDPRLLASASRADLVDFLRDQGSQLSPDAPVGELVGELRRLGVAGDGFAAAYTRARYGPPETAFVAAIETRLELGRVLARLRDSVGAPRRVRGFLAVRSLRSG